MSGDSRVRHCESCGRDVLNTATMTPKQIEAIITRSGPLPCMRMVRNEDGSLLTAQEMRSPSRWSRLVAAFSTVAMTASLAAQSGSSSRDHEAGGVQGQVVDPTGAIIPRSKVDLVDRDGKILASTTTDATGTFHLEWSKGEYQIIVSAAGFEKSKPQDVSIAPGVEATKPPIRLQIQSIEMGVCVTLPDGYGLNITPSESTDLLPPVPYPSGKTKKQRKTKVSKEKVSANGTPS